MDFLLHSVPCKTSSNHGFVEYKLPNNRVSSELELSFDMQKIKGIWTLKIGFLIVLSRIFPLYYGKPLSLSLSILDCIEKGVRHTSDYERHHIPRLSLVEKYASDRYITGSTPHYIPPAELILNRS